MKNTAQNKKYKKRLCNQQFNLQKKNPTYNYLNHNKFKKFKLKIKMTAIWKIS